jgi:hypothetical protein
LEKPPQDVKKTKVGAFVTTRAFENFIHKRQLKTGISVSCREQIIGPGNPAAEEIDYFL